MNSLNITDVNPSEIKTGDVDDIDLEEINSKLSGMERVKDIFVEVNNDDHLYSVTVELVSNIPDMVAEVMIMNDLVYHQSYVQTEEDGSLPEDDHTHRVEFIPRTDGQLKAVTAEESAEEFETVNWD